MESDVILTPAETAAKLIAKQETLTKWRSIGRGPAYLKLSGKIRYRLADVEDFIQKSRVVPGERSKPRRRPMNSNKRERASAA
jgi:hypothetical protein